MGKFSAYKVDLVSMRQDVQKIEYLLDNQFFVNIESEDVQKGEVKVSLTVTRVGEAFVFDFKLNGNAVIACDRCLEAMDFPINTTAKLVVKLGTEYAEGADDVITVPEKEGFINIAWFLYEFVALEIPLKHVHPAGQCSRTMMNYLKKHVVTGENDDDNDEADFDEIIDLQGESPEEIE
ncbi:hypothetical protein AGMMS49525_17930 [Bacteroidia bacterium]|nr:hypothetical protein AGMMS49525_17930 [Bacteroidia bacterium]